MTNQIEIGNYIAKLRKDLKLTQGALAGKLGISYQAISKWETGETLPDTGILLQLADVLNTTTDKILSGGNLIIRTGKFVNVADIKQGIDSLINLKHLLGRNNTFYIGAIDGINKRMNINFEEMIQDETRREFLIGEVIIQYLMEGYSVDYDDVTAHIKSDKLRNIIKKYMGEKSQLDKIYYANNKSLFDQIRAIRPEFKDLSELTLLPGEYIHHESGKDYWCSQIETKSDYCYGIAVDKNKIIISTYGFGGQNQVVVHEEMRKD